MGATDDLDARLFSPDDWVEGKPTGHPDVVLGLPRPKGDPVTKTTAETEAARIARGPDRAPEKTTLSEDALLSAARSVVKQDALLEQLKEQRRALEEQTSAAEAIRRKAHSDLTGTAAAQGETKAFQVGDVVVVVSWKLGTSAAMLEIVPLVSKEQS